MANKQLPDNLHILRGTYRPDRHGDPKAKPSLAHGAPRCPSWLSSAAKSEWKRIIQILGPANFLTEADRGILAVYCHLWGAFQANPDRFTAAMYTQMRLVMGELGLTPVSRSKVTVATPPNDEHDPWADF